MGFLAIAPLGLASGYAAFVWFWEAREAKGQHHPARSVGYGMLGLANLADLILIAFNFAGRPLDLPRGTVIVLLFPIIFVPALIVHRARRASTAIIDKARTK